MKSAQKACDCAGDPVLLAIQAIIERRAQPEANQTGGSVDANQWADIKSKGVGYIPGIAMWEGVLGAPRVVSYDAIWMHPFEESIRRKSKQQKEYLKAHPQIYQAMYDSWRKGVLEHLSPEDREAAEKQMGH